MEVVVHGLRLLYLPTPLARLKVSLQSVTNSMIEWDADQQVASSRAKVAERVKSVILKDVVVQQPLPDTEDLPYQARIGSLCLENVTSDFREIMSVMGLPTHDLGDDGDTPVGSGTPVEDMSVEELQAEVMRLRSRSRF